MVSNQCHYKKSKMEAPGNLKAFVVVNFVLPRLSQSFINFNFSWSRQQAVDFMVENTAMSLHNINTEIDRYIIWPGQVGCCTSALALCRCFI